jgi:hypothetical protein
VAQSATHLVAHLGVGHCGRILLKPVRPLPCLARAAQGGLGERSADDSGMR